MVIVLKVSFSPAHERILLIGSVQRTAGAQGAACRGERGARVQASVCEEALLSLSRAPGHSLAQQPWGPDKVPIARELPTLLP